MEALCFLRRAFLCPLNTMSFRPKGENYTHIKPPCKVLILMHSFLLPEINSGQAVPRRNDMWINLSPKKQPKNLFYPAYYFYIDVIARQVDALFIKPA